VFEEFISKLLLVLKI